MPGWSRWPLHAGSPQVSYQAGRGHRAPGPGQQETRPVDPRQRQTCSHPPSTQRSSVQALPSSHAASPVQALPGVVDVVTGVQVPLVHASQQLGRSLRHAPRCGSGVHCAVFDRMAHLKTPVGAPPGSTQHATAPSRPHVERAAQRTTAARHRRRSRPARISSSATPAMHSTYVPCRAAVAQSQWTSAAARVAATASASPGRSPQSADATRTAAKTKAQPTRALARKRMANLPTRFPDGSWDPPPPSRRRQGRVGTRPRPAHLFAHRLECCYRTQVSS